MTFDDLFNGHSDHSDIGDNSVSYASCTDKLRGQGGARYLSVCISDIPFLFVNTASKNRLRS